MGEPSSDRVAGALIHMPHYWFRRERAIAEIVDREWGTVHDDVLENTVDDWDAVEHSGAA